MLSGAGLIALIVVSIVFVRRDGCDRSDTGAYRIEAHKAYDPERRG